MGGSTAAAEPLARGRYAEYIGAPYLARGRTPEGWDCWGLVRWVLREEFAVELPSLDGAYGCDNRDESDRAVRADIVGDLAATLADPTDDPREGDVIVLRAHGHPIHVGVVIGGGRFLHVHEKRATCIERYDGLEWRNRITGFYRLRALS